MDQTTRVWRTILEKGQGVVMYRVGADDEFDLVYLRIEDIQAIITDMRKPRTTK